MLEVVTPERVMLSEPVTQTIAPGTEGYLGILANHIPLMTALRPGEVKVYLADQRTTSHIVVSGGFLQVGRAKTTILADSAVRIDEINVSQAQADLADARRLLASLAPGSPESLQAQQDADFAEAMLRAARDGK